MLTVLDLIGMLLTDSFVGSFTHDWDEVSERLFQRALFQKYKKDIQVKTEHTLVIWMVLKYPKLHIIGKKVTMMTEQYHTLIFTL